MINEKDNVKKVIVCSGCRRLIGEIETDSSVSPGENVTLKKAAELHTEVLFMPSPDGRLGTSIQHFVLALDAEEDFVDISVRVDNIRFFDDMPDKGLKYENMMARFEQQITAHRAEKANIKMAHKMPNQQTKSPIIL